MHADTSIVRRGEELDLDALAKYLVGRIDGAAAGIGVEQFPGGHSNLTYLLDIGGREYVLRRAPLGPVAPKAHDMARESRVLQAVHPHFPPAPAVFLLCEDPAVIGAVFFMLMVGAVAAGVTVTVKVQIIMSTIEVALLVLFAALALFHAHHVTAFSWHWFSPSVFHDKGSGTFAAGALIAAFFYWGWDVTANLNEETKKPPTTSGRGGVIGVIIVFLLFEVFTVSTNLVLTPAQLQDPNNSSNILAILGQAVWHGWGGKLLILSVVLSTVATLETTLIQVTRTLFTMGRDHTLPKSLGLIHKVRKTPIVATATVAVFSLLLFVASSAVGSVYNILNDGVTAIGLQICIYYGLAGFSVVILYRRQLFKSVGNFIFMGLWPFVGALFMVWVLVEEVNSLRTSNPTALWIGLGAMALGLIPMGYYWAKGNPYFKMPSKLDRHAQLIELQQMEGLL